jgi:Na+/citrate or Na+/malate symporter
MRNKFRHANISLAITAVLLIVHTLIFYDNETAMSVGGAILFFFCLGLLFFLDEREYRARHPDGDDSD